MQGARSTLGKKRKPKQGKSISPGPENPRLLASETDHSAFTRACDRHRESKAALINRIAPTPFKRRVVTRTLSQTTPMRPQAREAPPLEDRVLAMRRAAPRVGGSKLEVLQAPPPEGWGPCPLSLLRRHQKIVFSTLFTGRWLKCPGEEGEGRARAQKPPAKRLEWKALEPKGSTQMV